MYDWLHGSLRLSFKVGVGVGVGVGGEPLGNISYRRRMITGTTKPADPRKSMTRLASHCWIEAIRSLSTATAVE